jgi:hypothetical protein
VFQVLLASDNHKNSELDILVLNNYKKELMEGKMHIQYSCAFCFLPSLWPQRKREWHVRGRNTTWKLLREISKPRRSAYRRPWCKVSSTWNDLFFFPPKQKFWENAQDMMRLACRRKQDRGMKKWRVCWRDRRERILYRYLSASWQAGHGMCVYILKSLRPRGVGRWHF